MSELRTARVCVEDFYDVMKRNVQKNLIQPSKQVQAQHTKKKMIKVTKSTRKGLPDFFPFSPWIQYVFILMIML